MGHWREVSMGQKDSTGEGTESGHISGLATRITSRARSSRDGIRWEYESENGAGVANNNDYLVILGQMNHTAVETVGATSRLGLHSCSRGRSFAAISYFFWFMSSDAYGDLG